MLKLIVILILAVALTACSGPAKTSAQASGTTKTEAQCKISLVDEEHHPEFRVNQSALSDLSQEPTYRRAYFAMGCFWGSEAMLGSAEGVVSTQVGFAGGTLPDPSYSAIGDHVETVEVVYDPERLTYDMLLRHFWANHNSRAKPIFRQYASAVFTSGDAELRQAKSRRKAWQSETGVDKILTAVLPLDRFYPAGLSHQKYYLQQDQVLLKSLPETALNSLLATKLNAVSGRAGERDVLEKTLDEFGMSKEAQGLLFQRAIWPER